MARKPKIQINEDELTKGQIRTLNAGKKIFGERIGEKAFAEWLAEQAPTDKNAEIIADELQKLRESKRGLNIPRGGYIVKSGRGRVIVEPASS